MQEGAKINSESKVSQYLNGRLDTYGLSISELYEAAIATRTQEPRAGADLMARGDIDEELARRGWHAEQIAPLLDFENPENYWRTGTLMEILGEMYFEVASEDMTGIRSESVVNFVRDLVEKAITEQKGSYLLQLRARKLVEEIDSESILSQPEHMEENVLVPDLGKNISREDMADLRFLLTRKMKEIVANEFGIEVDSLPSSEQFWFLKFVKNKAASEIEPVKKFVRQYGPAGLRTFLALDYGAELGDGIVALGNSVDSKVAQSIVAKYGEILDSGVKARSYLDTVAGDDKAKQAIVARTTENLALRGRKLLERYVEALKSGKLENADELLAELGEIQAGNELFLATFKALPEEERLRALETMEDAGFELKLGKELSSEDIAAMRKIYTQNYRDPKYAKLLPLLLTKFEESIKDDKARARFYTFRHKGVIRAFNRFTQVVTSKYPYQSHKYFGAFNVERLFAGASIGETMILATLDEEAQDSKIEADCEAESAIAMNYIERGFIADRYYQLEGVNSLHIWRNDEDYIRGEENYAYPSKKMSREGIIEASKTGITSGLLVISAETQLGLKLEKNIGANYVLTRYFHHKASDMFYAVLEKRREEPEPSAYIF